MQMIGLTGGIASGKTTVGNILKEYGVAVVSADELAHDVIMLGQPLHEQIIAEFGAGIRLADGEIDLSELGKIIFSDATAKKRLEELIHPVVIQAIKDIIASHRLDPEPLMVFEIPLLFEIEQESLFDEIWVVSVGDELQLNRLIERNHFPIIEAQRRVDAQLPLAVKRGKADVVIYNDGGIRNTRDQVLELLKRFGVKV